MSHTGIVQPSGPSIQRRTRPASVWASKISSRGASNTRVTRTSRSLGKVTSTGWGMVVSLGLGGGSAPDGLELVEQVVEALVVAFPDLAVALDPRGGLVERSRFHPARPALAVASAADQPGVLQHLQVLGDRR